MAHFSLSPIKLLMTFQVFLISSPKVSTPTFYSVTLGLTTQTLLIESALFKQLPYGALLRVCVFHQYDAGLPLARHANCAQFTTRPSPKIISFKGNFSESGKLDPRVNMCVNCEATSPEGLELIYRFSCK